MTSDFVVQELKAFVAREFLQGKTDGLDAQTPLLEWGIIDSIAIVSLIRFIQDRFQVEIPTSEITPDNLKNLSSLSTVVLRLEAA
jgi:acyl carrier protein